MLALFPIFSKKIPSEDREVALFVFQRFGYRIKNAEHFKCALTHKSISNNNNEISNERLEFLGDAILDAVVAEILYNKFPEEDEGYLTKIKSKVVSRRTLAMIGSEMGIEKVMKYNRRRSLKIETLEGNAFEALIGAIYIDGNIMAVKKAIVQHIFQKYVNLNQVLEEEIDFKSKLFIWCQKNRAPLTFEILTEDNQGTTWNYVVRAMINEKEFGRGSGSTKKKAEQAASKETLQLIGED